MCICLNCNYINVCKQYFFIEKIHKELSINKNSYFNPLNYKYTENNYVFPNLLKNKYELNFHKIHPYE